MFKPLGKIASIVMGIVDAKQAIDAIVYGTPRDPQDLADIADILSQMYMYPVKIEWTPKSWKFVINNELEMSGYWAAYSLSDIFDRVNKYFVNDYKMEGEK